MLGSHYDTQTATVHSIHSHVRVTLQHTNCNGALQCESKNRPRFSDIFPKWLGFFMFCSDFYMPKILILYVPIYAQPQIFIQLSATLMKLRHIKCDHPVHTIWSKWPPSAETHIVVFWHFPKTVGNFQSKFYTPITLYTFLSTLYYKFLLVPNRLRKKSAKLGGWYFLTHTVRTQPC